MNTRCRLSPPCPRCCRSSPRGCVMLCSMCPRRSRADRVELARQPLAASARERTGSSSSTGLPAGAVPPSQAAAATRERNLGGWGGGTAGQLMERQKGIMRCHPQTCNTVGLSPPQQQKPYQRKALAVAAAAMPPTTAAAGSGSWQTAAAPAATGTSCTTSLDKLRPVPATSPVRLCHQLIAC